MLCQTKFKLFKCLLSDLGKIDRTVPSFDIKYKLGENSRTPKRSKSFLSKIRKGGQNLKVRVRTSADLWRRWIRGGIMYNTELDEKDELEHEEQVCLSYFYAIKTQFFILIGNQSPYCDKRGATTPKTPTTPSNTETFPKGERVQRN